MNNKVMLIEPSPNNSACEKFEDMTWLFSCDNRNRGIIRMNFNEAALLWRCVQETQGSILEIGRRHGGSTCLILAASGDRPVISIDLAPAHHENTEAFFSRPDYQSRLKLLVGDSRLPTNGSSYGMIFFDGDHTFEGIRSDVLAHWNSLSGTNNCLPLAVFHDAVPNPGLSHENAENHCEGVRKICDALVDSGCGDVYAQAGSVLVLVKRANITTEMIDTRTSEMGEFISNSIKQLAKFMYFNPQPQPFLQVDWTQAGTMHASVHFSSEMEIGKCFHTQIGCADAAITPARQDNAESYETVFNIGSIDSLSDDAVLPALSELYRIAKKNLCMFVKTRAYRDRAWWEQKFFEAGFRKHPCIQKIIPYEHLPKDKSAISLFFSKIPPAAKHTYPAEVLKKERDLHMDMLRESGARSDAHIARYQLAAAVAKNGDVILDAACGLGYGSALLAMQFPAATIIGLDSSAYGIAYAKDNFAGVLRNLEFYQYDVCDLRQALGDRKVDLLVTFETIEHVTDPARFLDEVIQCMHPDGRFIGSVPNAWMDANGGPGPYHLHIFDYGKFKSLLEPRFNIDAVYRQNAEHGVKGDFGRILRQIQDGQPSSQDLAEAEWWIMKGHRNSQSSLSVKPVLWIDRAKWENTSQQAEFNYHRTDQWRQTPDFMNQTAALFASFDLFAKDYKGKTVIDLGAGSKLRSRYFSDSTLIAIEPLAARFMKELDWCDLGQASELYSYPAEKRIENCIGRGDLLICINVLDHCFDFQAIIENIRLYLKDGGLAFISFDKHGISEELHPLALTEQTCERVFSDKGLIIEKQSTGLREGLGLDSYGHSGYCLNYWLRKPIHYPSYSSLDGVSSVPLGSNEQARVSQLNVRSKADWLLLPTGVTQLQSMVAALNDLGISYQGSRALSIIGIYNDAMQKALEMCSQVFGLQYVGNFLNTLMDFQIDPQSLDEEEIRHWDKNPTQFVADKLESHFPNLQAYRGLSIIAPARPNMPEDFFMLSALNPSELILVADGIQNEVIIRRRSGSQWRGFNREIADFPTSADIWCPEYLLQDTSGIGTARIIRGTTQEQTNTQLRNSYVGQHLRQQILSLGQLPQSIVISQHFALSNLCSEQEENDYYFAIIRHLIRRDLLPILIKRHPRDPISKTKRLTDFFADYASRIIFTDDLASCVPIECLSSIWADRVPTLVGSSSSALLGLRLSLQSPAYCADAEFLPDQMRKQILHFSAKHNISRLSL